MVKFDDENRTYSIIVNGDESQYFGVLRALARLLASIDEQALEKDTIYFVSSLLEEMLPSPEQDIRIETK